MQAYLRAKFLAVFFCLKYVSLKLHSHVRIFLRKGLRKILT